MRDSASDMNTKTPKRNGLDEPSPQSASSIVQRSRLRRTLLFAGVFALLAMIFVPMPVRDRGGGGGYRLIFDVEDTRIAFFQLLLNVGFAGLAGAIAANLSKRALYVIGACIAVVAFGVGVLALKRGMEDAAYRADSDERYANRLLQWKELQYGQMDRVQLAEDNLRSAATNWRLALRFGEAKRLEQKAEEVAKMSAGERSRINQGQAQPNKGFQWVDEPNRVPKPWELFQKRTPAPAKNIFDQLSPPASRFNDQIAHLKAEYKAAVERGDLGAFKKADAELRALGVKP
jgi:hypothetical protein